ncbi:cytochrome P450 87A3 [Citrus sinensis]|nr:cytochrome P450 87A3 [Citrus sinensis]
MKMMIEDRQAKLPEERTRGDFLEHIVEDMKTNNLLTSDLISYMMFGLLLATFETISTTLTLTVMLLTQHPLLVQELERENKEIVQKRRNVETGMTWEEFRSLTFTKQVINEVLRMGNFVPGFLRRAIKDIQIKEYTIPEGWTIMVVPSAIHLNPETYTDPFVFNPWRWKDLAENNVTSAKNFIPFGEGIRLCPGAEFSKVLMTLFLNVLATKYSWSQVKPGEIIRAPTMGFGKGYYIKVAEKSI